MAVLNRAVARSQPKATASLRLGPVLLVAGAAIVGIALLQIVQTSEATTTSFAIQRLEQGRLELETEVRQLEADVAALSALSRIQQEVGRLGLEPPQARAAVEVNEVWPAADEARLPTRFSPGTEEQAEEDGRSDGSEWWRDLLKALPFY